MEIGTHHGASYNTLGTIAVSFANFDGSE